VGIGTNSPGTGIRLDVLGGEIRAGRVDSSSEGGQVSFSRSSDNATAWYLDVFGNTSTPSLRVVDVSAGAVRATFDSSGNFQFNSGYGSVATAYGCRAWANMGVSGGTLTVNSSAGFSSITRTQTGYFTAAFSNTMPDANYSLCGNVSSGVGLGYLFWNVSGSPGTNSTTTMYFNTATGGGFADYPRFSIAVFR
jgi:hypothetical protein